MSAIVEAFDKLSRTREENRRQNRETNKKEIERERKGEEGEFE